MDAAHPPNTTLYLFCVPQAASASIVLIEFVGRCRCWPSRFKPSSRSAASAACAWRDSAVPAPSEYRDSSYSRPAESAEMMKDAVVTAVTASAWEGWRVSERVGRLGVWGWDHLRPSQPRRRACGGCRSTSVQSRSGGLGILRQMRLLTLRGRVSPV